MSSNKQQLLGEDYLVEIANNVVEVWQILTKEHKGGDNWGLSLTFHDRRSLPLSTEDARKFVAEFISDNNPEARQSIVDTLSGQP
jgi:hypothetical protein